MALVKIFANKMIYESGGLL